MDIVSCVFPPFWVIDLPHFHYVTLSKTMKGFLQCHSFSHFLICISFLQNYFFYHPPFLIFPFCFSLSQTLLGPCCFYISLKNLYPFWISTYHPLEFRINSKYHMKGVKYRLFWEKEKIHRSRQNITTEIIDLFIPPIIPRRVMKGLESF